jgi:hypothetical protein
MSRDRTGHDEARLVGTSGRLWRDGRHAAPSGAGNRDRRETRPDAATYRRVLYTGLRGATVRSRMPSVARSAPSDRIGKIAASRHTGSMFDQS